MVSINIFGKFFYSIFKKRGKKLDMLWFFDNLYYLLDRSCTVRMPAKTHWIHLHILNDLGQLLIVAAFSYLLG